MLPYVIPLRNYSSTEAFTEGPIIFLIQEEQAKRVFVDRSYSRNETPKRFHSSRKKLRAMFKGWIVGWSGLSPSGTKSKARRLRRVLIGVRLSFPHHYTRGEKRRRAVAIGATCRRRGIWKNSKWKFWTPSRYLEIENSLLFLVDALSPCVPPCILSVIPQKARIAS
ncbi:hypothetical protein HZH66_010123 [Vespula vulgaris]|uniref:Uncharacterized protein n=1 Tax=Vespula vulgaris TaxID=7454 RepID=A0A834JIB5_VESVU|nr:hypothetical protein HZH66_010123 [Vespula vulgaris]